MNHNAIQANEPPKKIQKQIALKMKQFIRHRRIYLLILLGLIVRGIDWAIVQSERVPTIPVGHQSLSLEVGGLGGTSQAPEFLVGKNTDKLNATKVIWAFFDAISLDQ